MEAIKLHKIVEKDGELSLTGLPCHKGEDVELILLIKHKDREENRNTETLLDSGLRGIWKDRTDIGGSADFARELRTAAQKRNL